MSNLTKERVKAFIDDLAYIQHKHGIEVVAELGGLELSESNGEVVKVHRFSGYYEDGVRMDSSEWSFGEMNGFCEYENIESIDPSKMSAHEKMEMERWQ